MSMSFQSTVRPSGVRASSRDPYRDLIRSWAILRVVSVHLLGLAPAALLWWPAPTFVAPGMPLVFFVSGALALKSLDPWRARRVSAAGFWRDRLRRLLIPFWVYLTVALSVTIALDLLHPEEMYTVSWLRSVLSAVPLINPINSPAGFLGMAHLWFLVVICWLLLLAPALVWLHRRAPRLLLAGSVALLLGASYVTEHTTTFVYAEVNSISLFQFFFVLGFWYTDGVLVRGVVPGRDRGIFDGLSGVGIAALAFPGAWLVWQIESPLAVHDSALVHALLGLGWLSLLLVARPLVLRLAEAMPRLLNRLTRRTLTIYLWGWPTAALAQLAVNTWGLTGPLALVVFFGLAIGGLVVAVRVFGRVEDFAAGRQPQTASAGAMSAGSVAAVRSAG
ncbi:MAG: hypothetical protein QG597_2735 [Actinomycetota bacterium]|nr:hypothetical protein [Actinomycetota bacterium]